MSRERSITNVFSPDACVLARLSFHIVFNTAYNFSMVTYVNSGVGPSSGSRRGFPLASATTSGSRLNADPPPASPRSLFCLRRRGGFTSGDPPAPPALSLRWFGLEALNGPPSGGRVREGVFPPMAIPVGDEGEFTRVSTGLNKWFVPNCVRLSDVARGFDWDPLTLVRGRSSIPSRYLIDWGACPKTYL